MTKNCSVGGIELKSGSCTLGILTLRAPPRADPIWRWNAGEKRRRKHGKRKGRWRDCFCCCWYCHAHVSFHSWTREEWQHATNVAETLMRSGTYLVSQMAVANQPSYRTCACCMGVAHVTLWPAGPEPGEDHIITYYVGESTDMAKGMRRYGTRRAKKEKGKEEKTQNLEYAPLSVGEEYA